MGESLVTLLRAASDPVGDVRPPAVAELVARRRRRTGLRTGSAMLATAATVITVAAVVAHRPDRPAGHRDVPPPISRPRPTAVGVTVEQLGGYRWRALPPAPIPPRGDAVAVWTGHEVIVWGGVRGDVAREDGAAYDPVTRRWTTLPSAPIAGANAQAVWTGRAMVVWTFEQGGASYDPVDRKWTRLPKMRDMYPAALVAWQGWAVLLHGAHNATVVHADAVDPRAATRWQHLPELRLAAQHGLEDLVAMDDGVDLYVWADWSHSRAEGPNGSVVTSGVEAFHLGGTRWTSAPGGPDHGLAANGVALVAGRFFFPQTSLACVTCSGPLLAGNHGRLVDPVTGAGTPAPPTFRARYASTGRAMLALNTSGGDTKPGDLAAWEPGRSRWLRLPPDPHGGSGKPTILWGGDRLFVWGSRGGLEFAG